MEAHSHLFHFVPALPCSFAAEISAALSPLLCSEVSLQDSLVFFRNPVFPTLLPASSSITNLPITLHSHSSVDSELTTLCQSVLEDFNLCLFYLPSSPNLSLASEDEEEYESGYAFLPDLLIFQMVVICLMSVHSLKRAGNFLVPLLSSTGLWDPHYPFLLLYHLPSTNSLFPPVALRGCGRARDKAPYPEGPPDE